MKKAVSQFTLFILLAVLFTAVIVNGPRSADDPAASPEDQAREDLSRVAYPSTDAMGWKPLFIRPQDTLESLFGKDWELVARFNRIDRRHVYPGIPIKSPNNMDDIKNSTPMPQLYDPARTHKKYILVNMEEQWLGAYEYGVLKFSVPAATGKPGFETPTGLFRIDARHKNHTSSLYKTDDEQAQYPMDYALRFHIGADDVAYWIHARDLPGRPASHGCIGLYDEAMQQRIFKQPVNPVLADARRLYEWAVGEDDYEGPDTGEFELVEDGPIVEVAGRNPTYLPSPPRRARENSW